MARIKTLKVKVAYTVWLKDVDVSDGVLKSMIDLSILGGAHSDYLMPKSTQDSIEWIADNIKQGDALDFETEIEELEF